MTVPDVMAGWGETFAADPAHGYSQTDRWGNDTDCSALVIRAAEAAGIHVREQGASYTGNMRGAFLRCGFEDVTDKIDQWTGAGLKKGDVLLNIQNHAALMVSSTQLVQATANEFGGVSGGQTGDQTGKEISVRNYYRYSSGWDCVLRYTAEDDDNGDHSALYAVGNPDNADTGVPAVLPTEPVKIYTAELPLLTAGAEGDAVELMQLLLELIGYDFPQYGADGEYGDETRYTVMGYQYDHGLEADGECGPKTWGSILKELRRRVENGTD